MKVYMIGYKEYALQFPTIGPLSKNSKKTLKDTVWRVIM